MKRLKLIMEQMASDAMRIQTYCDFGRAIFLLKITQKSVQEHSRKRNFHSDNAIMKLMRRMFRINFTSSKSKTKRISRYWNVCPKLIYIE